MSAMSKTISQIKAYASARGLPIIPVQANNIFILEDPQTFYDHILKSIKTCNKRLHLSSLYLGTGPKEEAIIQAICDNLESNELMPVDITLDAHRARRFDRFGRSSLTLLYKLSYFRNVNINLFDGSKHFALGPILERMERWNELLSTYHAKAVITDDNLLMTGANLSNIYFEKRQDRYILFRDSPLLCQYLSDMFRSMARISDTSLYERIRKTNKLYTDSLRMIAPTDSDSFVIPICQYGPSGVNDKEAFMTFLASILPENAKIHLSTGYFNPSKSMETINLTTVLAPSESANGFYGGSGFLRYVPSIYTAIQNKYVSLHPSSEMFNFNKPSWSFHAKGVWIEGLQDYYIHILGSSNFNQRSSARDFETQLVLVTKNRHLIQELEQERLKLWSNSVRTIEQSKLKNFIYVYLSNILKSLL